MYRKSFILIVVSSFVWVLQAVPLNTAGRTVVDVSTNNKEYHDSSIQKLLEGMAFQALGRKGAGYTCKFLNGIGHEIPQIQKFCKHQSTAQMHQVLRERKRYNLAKCFLEIMSSAESMISADELLHFCNSIPKLHNRAIAQYGTNGLVFQPEQDAYIFDNEIRNTDTKEDSNEFPIFKPENGPYLEGDIMEPLPVLDERSGVIPERYRWPNKTVIYEFNSSFPEDFRQTFLSGLNQITGRTCIRFKQRTTESDYVHVLQKSGCSSYIGRISGRQDLSLGTFGCRVMGVHIHEVIHAIGFHHEQSRTDRDDFVIINWENIGEGYERNFNKYNSTQVSPFDVPYDYGSLMHYSRTAFSSNGKDTITPRDPAAVIGQVVGMSNSDSLKINNMYCPRTLGIRLRNLRDGNYLQVNGGSSEGKAVITSAWTNADHQKWTVHWNNVQEPSIGSSLVPWSQDGGQVKSMNEVITPSSRITVTGESSSNYQQWTIRKIGTEDNPWQVVNHQTGRCLYSNGVGMQTSTVPCNASDESQIWNIYAA